MNRIKVNPNEYLKYKQTEFVEPGEYFIIQNARFDDRQKKVFKPIACTDKNNVFSWLLPAEKWIEWVYEGFKDKEYNAEIDLKDFFPPIKLRNWQEQFLKEMLIKLKAEGTFKYGLTAPIGSGKTLFGLMLCLLDPSSSLVLAPRYLQDDWTKEALKWKLPIPQFTTYESAYKYKNRSIFVLDEVLAVKNPLAQRTKRVMELIDKAKIAIGMTGTPLGAKTVNDLRWLNCINPSCFPNTEKQTMFLWGEPYLEEVEAVGKVWKNKIWHMDQIAAFTSHVMKTVDMEEIRAELPEITYHSYDLKLDEDQFYEVINGYYANNKHKRSAQATQFSDGFVYATNGEPIPFHTQKIDWLKQFIEDNPDESIVVFALWRETFNMLRQAFPDAAFLTGETGDTAYVIDRFKSKETNLMCASVNMSQGMNLQEVCRIVIFFSNSTKPELRFQAEGRVYRPGQKRAVQIIDLYGTEIDKKHVEALRKYRTMDEAYIEALLEHEIEKINERKKK